MVEAADAKVRRMTQVLMPALSPTMTEGKLARWLKKIGDEVRAGDVIAEIETDKATMEVEAVDEGLLSEILVGEGTDGVAVNTPIAVLNGDGAAAVPPAKPAFSHAGSSGSRRRRAPRWPIGRHRAGCSLRQRLRRSATGDPRAR